jgi:hypothetical protein
LLKSAEDLGIFIRINPPFYFYIAGIGVNFWEYKKLTKRDKYLECSTEKKKHLSGQKIKERDVQMIKKEKKG